MAGASYGLVTDWYPIDAFTEFCDLADRLTEDHKALTQTDAWGCVTATAAFIINQCIGEKCLTAADMDVEIGRMANKAGDMNKLAQWLLERDFHLDMYVPPKPIDSIVDDFVSGKIVFDDIFPEYEAIYGKVSQTEMTRVRNYFEEVYIPARMEGDRLLSEHYKNGRATLHTNNLSSQLLASHLRRGAYFFGLVPSTQFSFAGHVISIFRPEPYFPAMVFSPDQVGSDGSSISPFDSEWRGLVVNQNRPFSFISNPHAVTKKDLGL